MKITTLKLNNFRNIRQANLQLDDNPIVALYGENGAGKTSVLEALSLLSPGRGLHRHKLDSHIQHGEKEWVIYSTLNTKQGEETVGMSFTKGKRETLINGEKAENQTNLSTLGNVLWFTPKMDRLFMDSTTARREFLDRLVFSHFPNHAWQLNRYKHHLKSRLKLLKEDAPTDWLDIEEEQAAAHAQNIAQNRQEYLKVLKPYLENVHLTLTGSFENLEEFSAKIIQQELHKNRQRDSRFGASHFGPHRSHVEGILFPENIPLVETSTGQHKRALLEILLANARLTHHHTGTTPILLLDEVAAHLDKKNKTYFFSELIKLGTQIWLTGTEKDMFQNLANVQFIHAENGLLKKV